MVDRYGSLRDCGDLVDLSVFCYDWTKYSKGREKYGYR